MGTVLHTDGSSVEAQSIRSHHSHHSHSHDHKHKSIGNLEDKEEQKDKNAKLVENTVAASRENYNM